MAPNKNRKSSAAERFAPAAQQPKSTGASQAPPKRYGLLALFLLISIGGTFLAISLRPKPLASQYKAVAIAKYPHDAKAFTQGLVWEDGVLNDKYFGEGLAILNDKLYQQTWKNHKALVYDRDLNQIADIPYDTQGWGLATDGKLLIFSDGTNRIRFVDPDTFKTVRSITVIQPGGRRITELNELEYIEGNIYANRWNTETIYEIDPDSGDVTKTISLAGLWPAKDRPWIWSK